jgi:hypothetical protein
MHQCLTTFSHDFMKKNKNPKSCMYAHRINDFITNVLAIYMHTVDV